MHISASQIQCPGDIVESRHQHTIGMFFAQGLADTGNLFTTALTCILHRKNLHSMLRDSRAIGPDLCQRIEISTQRDATLLTQIGYQLLHSIHRRAPAIECHFGPGSTLLAYPLSDGRRSGHLQFHQLELGATQLLLGSNKIARVGPQGCRSHRHYSRTSRAVKATDKLASFPMIGHVFALMRVGTWKDKRSEMFAFHHLAKSFNSLIYCHHHRVL